MKWMVFCFIYSFMLGKSFPYGESILFIAICFSVLFFIKGPDDDDDDDGVE